MKFAAKTVSGMMVLLALGLSGCSFEAQPVYPAEICIEAKKDGKVVKQSKASLNALVTRDNILTELKLDDAKVIPTFAAHHEQKDHYRIKYIDKNESNLADVQFDGNAKTIVWDNASYSVYIQPAGK